MPLSSLRPHQEAALSGLRSSILEGKRRPVLHLPTGAGKTVVAAHIVTGAVDKRKRVAFCVPALSLIDQTFDRFCENGIDPSSMGVIQGNHPWRRPHAPIQICSIQTLNKRDFPMVDSVVVDEAHMRFWPIENWMQKEPEKIFIGLSATPWSKGMGDSWNNLVSPTSLKELIDGGWLSPFRIFASSHPDLSGVRVTAGEYQLDQLSSVMSGKAIVADVVANWIEKGEGRPTLCFCVDRAHAAHIHNQFAECGVASEYVDGETPREDRNEILARFSSGQTKVICSVGVMTTGVDVDCRCLILARPTKSEILYIQIIGRALRTAPGKTDALIFDHTDTTLKLGLPTSINHTRLRTAKTDAEEKKRKAEGKDHPLPLPRECRSCHAVIPAGVRACMACGHISQRQNTVETVDGVLYEFGTQMPTLDGIGVKKETAKSKLASIGKQEVFSQLRALQGTKKDGWLSHKYKEIFDVWPVGLDKNHPQEPSPELQMWIHHSNIRYAKSRQSERADADSDQASLADAA